MGYFQFKEKIFKNMSGSFFLHFKSKGGSPILTSLTYMYMQNNFLKKLHVLRLYQHSLRTLTSDICLYLFRKVIGILIRNSTVVLHSPEDNTMNSTTSRIIFNYQITFKKTVIKVLPFVCSKIYAFSTT